MISYESWSFDILELNVHNKMDHLESQVNLLDLPYEILCQILSYLSQDDIFWNVGFTCQALFRACLENTQFIQVSVLDHINLT